eukprot:TRINITY_DN296_c0_g1_i1.p1 TRINITY_DN296_c0_g1~~TRINITY_DN296_c0_g1_i1.p1  ORF type:complete len:237 (+),score=53.09 TRINITY_DN296_c0_g1_i1:30-740(+)
MQENPLNLHSLPTTLPSENIKQVAFSPYTNNGGTCIGVAGKNFAIVASDTRMSQGYSIMTRNKSKVIKLTDKCVLASSGMQSDIKQLQKVLNFRLRQYEFEHRKQMPTASIAQLLGNTLYGRRFFPYYTFNVLAGIDETGEGVVYSYDAVGSFEKVKYSASGTGQQLMIPLMDNQVGKKNQLLPSTKEFTPEEAIELLKDAFTSAGERDIYTGDFVDICRIDENGVELIKFELKED